MQLSDYKELLLEQYHQMIEVFMVERPIQGNEHLFHPRIVGFGTTTFEKNTNFEEFRAIIEATVEQGSGVDDMSYTNEIETIEFLDRLQIASIMDHFAIQYTMEGSKVNIELRFTCILEFIDGNWRMVHYHGSRAADSDDAWHMDEHEKAMEKLQAKVDEQTRKLQEREREANIETALERVRSRTMAMYESDELRSVISTVFEQLQHLGYEAEACGLVIFQDNGDAQHWLSGFNQDDYPKSYTIPYSNHPYFKQPYVDWKNGADYHTYTLEGPLKKEYDKWLLEETEFKSLPENVRDFLNNQETAILEDAFHKYGMLELVLSEPLPENEREVLSRFAGVFEQAYTRFLDLQKAEKQAYESRVEASLEKIRGMAAAMNHSDDLAQLAEAMFKELEYLKINPLRYGLGMIDGDKKEAELWASTVDDGKYLDKLGIISLSLHPLLEKAFDAWESQHEELTYELKGKELSDYYLKIGKINPDIPNLSALQDPNTDIIQYACFFPFQSGSLYAFTAGEPSEDGKSILKRFASVFEQAHIRYNDLQKTEKQAQQIRQERDRLETALQKLRSTQEQLIQQEKLASLGQLTAGIAHEIKNPLNFVNNFSDLSVELVEEAQEMLSSLSNELSEADHEKVTEAVDLLQDIEMNLRKIFDHGSRADGIVKSMLQHSRSSNGNMEPTDLNPLIQEYVNLAFHGMRAAHDPINVDIQLELDESAGKVKLVSEDFSRAIINLCNNAFDAMREKAQAESAFKPVLIVRTLKNGSAVYVDVEDNGCGIPKEAQTKIMQPFFTTKKGTEGTGLGLSITNDIIKAHGGFLSIPKSDETGSTFRIELNDTHE